MTYMVALRVLCTAQTGASTERPESGCQERGRIYAHGQGPTGGASPKSTIQWHAYNGPSGPGRAGTTITGTAAKKRYMGVSAARVQGAHCALCSVVRAEMELSTVQVGLCGYVGAVQETGRPASELGRACRAVRRGCRGRRHPAVPDGMCMRACWSKGDKGGSAQPEAPQ